MTANSVANRAEEGLLAGFLRRAWSDLGRLSQTLRGLTGLYVLLGGSLGAALIYVSTERSGFTGKVLEHLGAGFLVASFVGVAYEWRSATRKALEITSRFSAIMSEVARERFLNGMKELLLPEDDDGPHGIRTNLLKIIEACDHFVLTLADLRKDPGWATDQYISVLAALHETVIGANVQAFRNLDAGEQHIRVPRTAAEFADQILAAQMKATQAGDSYDVISDLASWKQGQLKDFTKTSEEKCLNGVSIRRIFNLFGEQSGDLSRQEIEAILREHLEASQASGGMYEAKILGPNEYEKLCNVRPPIKGVKLLKQAHWGIFEHKKGTPQEAHIRFRPRESDLSEMILSQLADPIKADKILFERAWEKASALDSEMVRQVAEEYSQGE